MPGLKAPGHPVPLALDVPSVIARVVELADLDVDVEVPLEVLLHELHLRGHLREVLVVEERRLEAVRVTGFGQELLGVGRTVLPPGTEVFQCRLRILVIDVRHATADDAVALVHGVQLLLAVDGHREGAANPHVVKRRPVLGQRHAERRQRGRERLHDGGGIRLADGLHFGRALYHQEVALASAERRHAGRGVRRRQDDVLVDVGAARVEVVWVALEHNAHLAGVLLEDIGPGADQALLEVAVLLDDLARKDHGDGFGDVLREQHVGRLKVDAQGMRIGRLHALDFLERERLHALLRVGLETVLDVGGDQLAPFERRHVLPLDAPAQLERPHSLVGAPLPGLGEVPLEAEVGVAGRLVREHMAQEAIAGEPGELEQPHGLGESRVDHRGIPGRGPGQDPAPLRRLGARRDPAGIRRGGGSSSPTGGDSHRGHPGAGHGCALEEITSSHAAASGLAKVGGGHRGSPPVRTLDEGKTVASSAANLP